jgi:hypothetical protein
MHGSEQEPWPRKAYAILDPPTTRPKIGWGQIGAKKHPEIPISADLYAEKGAGFIGSRRPLVGVIT